jgi:hypothetical protein
MFAVEVIADNSGKYCGNGMYYPTVEKAEEAAVDLFHRWLLVTRWRVVQVFVSWGGVTSRVQVKEMSN